MSAVLASDSQELAHLVAPTREQILALEAHMREFDQIECPLTHTFAPGSYARGICVPAGTLAVGKIHLHAHLNIVSRGLATVVTEFGRTLIDAREHPVIFTSPAGAKRVVYTHTETWWTTVHLTDKTDLAEIERDIIASNFVELDAALARACIELIESPEGPAELSHDVGGSCDRG